MWCYPVLMRFLHSGRVVTSVSLSTLSVNPTAATIWQALGGLFLHMYSLAISHRFTRNPYTDLLGSLPAHLAFFLMTYLSDYSCFSWSEL